MLGCSLTGDCLPAGVQRAQDSNQRIQCRSESAALTRATTCGGRPIQEEDTQAATQRHRWTHRLLLHLQLQVGAMLAAPSCGCAPSAHARFEFAQLYDGIKWADTPVAAAAAAIRVRSHLPS